MIEIIFYDTEDGRCPIQEYLDSLESKLLAKTLRTIDLLECNGRLLRGPYSEPLGDGIFELRTKQGSDITRVLYFFFVGNKAVLTNGFTKKMQKTPKAEIELAQKYKDDYERRHQNFTAWRLSDYRNHSVNFFKVQTTNETILQANSTSI